MPTQTQPDDAALKAIDRLIVTANGNDVNARLAADFLLGWLNSNDWGEFAPEPLGPLEVPAMTDINTVSALLAEADRQLSPLDFGRQNEIARLVYQWRSLD